MDEFARKVSEGRDGAHWEIIRLNALARYPIAKRRLEALAANDFADWRDARLTPVKPAPVAREMKLLPSVLAGGSGKANVLNPVNNAHLVCPLLLEKNKNK